MKNLIPIKITNLKLPCSLGRASSVQHRIFSKCILVSLFFSALNLSAEFGDIQVKYGDVEKSDSKIKTGDLGLATIDLGSKSKSIMDANSEIELLSNTLEEGSKKVIKVTGRVLAESWDPDFAGEIQTEGNGVVLTQGESRIVVKSDETGITVENLAGNPVLWRSTIAGVSRKWEIKSGERGVAPRGGEMKITAMVNAVNAVQWTLYYPAILNPADLRLLGLNPDSEDEISTSFTFYESGALTDAIKYVPRTWIPETNPEKLYRAALLIASQKVEDAIYWLDEIERDPALIKSNPSGRKSEQVSWLEVMRRELSSEDLKYLQPSLESFQAGDLKGALDKYPEGRKVTNEQEMAYLATLYLGNGNVIEAQKLLKDVRSPNLTGDSVDVNPGAVDKEAQSENSIPDILRLTGAMRKMIAAVQGKYSPETSSNKLSSEWLADSYYQQSRPQAHQEGELDGTVNYQDLGVEFRDSLGRARYAAQQAVKDFPDFKYGWVRLAETHFSHGDSSAAMEALAIAEPNGLENSANGQALTIAGFITADRGSTAEAYTYFNQAIDSDPIFAPAYLGRGLLKIRQRQFAQGRIDIEQAALFEPQNALFKSYLSKAWMLEEEDKTKISGMDDFLPALKKSFLPTPQPSPARKAIEEAKKLDPQDPTGFLYSALLSQRNNEINRGIRELEKSKEKNNNRRLFRSRYLLDQDQAVRSANLAGIYKDAGMEYVAAREANLAVQYDYANPSAHWFLANSYNQQRDINQVNLRYETPFLTEYLMSNLLGPVGGGTLSRTISQNEYSRLFERNRLGFSASAEYLEYGAFSEFSSQFGSTDRMEYAIDSAYLDDPGQISGTELTSTLFSAQFKANITTKDKIFLQALYSDFESGDVSPKYNTYNRNLTLNLQEELEPLVLAGYHREWSPNSHTLLLAGRVQSHQNVVNQTNPFLFVTTTSNLVSGSVANSAGLPVGDWDLDTDYTLYTVEAQQIYQTEHFATPMTFVAGARYQYGDLNSKSSMGSITTPAMLVGSTNTVAVPGIPLSPSVDQNLERTSVYAYHQWELHDSLMLNSGVSYDYLKYPLNFRRGVIDNSEDEVDQVSPKVGVIWNPISEIVLRAAYSRILGGVSFDQSFKLEPTQLAGVLQSYRGLIPEAVTGSLEAQEMDVFGFGLDQRFKTGTYLGVELDLLKSSADQWHGARSVETAFFSGFPNPGSYRLLQTHDYEERSMLLRWNQLLGDYFSTSLSYRLSQAELQSSFQDLPAFRPESDIDQTSTLHQVMMRGLFYFPNGFFGEGQGIWTQQSNSGGIVNTPGDDFWQFNLFGGYRFLQRRAEVRAGILNIADTDYQINPLNVTQQFPVERTYTLRVQMFF